MSITIFSQGAAGEVTGSRHFLFTDKAKILVDCGAFQGKREEADRKNRQWDFDASALDAVFCHSSYGSGILHAHDMAHQRFA